MGQKQVNTVFTVADQSSAPMARIAAGSEKLAKHTEKAREQLEQLEKSSKGVERSRTKTRGAPASEKGAAGGVSAEEKERFREEKEEMKLRRLRRRGFALDQQKEQTAHQAVMAATMLLAASQSKLAGTVMKFSNSIQATGMGMAMMGGRTGRIGQKLEQFGGYLAIAGMAIEGISAVAEAFGVDVEELTKEAGGFFRQSWIGRMLHMKTAEDAEKENSEKEMMALNKRLSVERKSTVAAERLAAKAEAMPLDKSSAAFMKWQAEAVEAAEKIHDQTGIPVEEALKKYEAAAVSSASALEAHTQHEHAISMYLEKYAKGLQSMSAHATDEDMDKHTQAVRASVNAIMLNTGAQENERAAITQMVEARAQQYGNYVDSLETTRKQMQVEAILADAQTRAAKITHLHVPADTASLKKKLKFMHALDLATASATMFATGELAKLGVEFTPEMLSEVSKGLSKRTTHIDFSHSRFDIKQAFAEGFDPDRIAVAFTNDLAALGERRLASAYSPTFGVK